MGMTDSPRPLTIAVAALGGQGGGVLSGWIVETAEAAGYIAQYTSVPGVAQRTGATVYCIELFPKAAAEAAGTEPVLALMPMPGDVEVVIAAELMEAGRAITRGFVTPDVTTLIASTHREYAIAEKSAPGDGIAEAGTVLKSAQDRAHHLVAFDMQRLADEAGSVISAALFGALAGSGALDIARERFEETIRKSGRMVEANLTAFAAAYERAQRQESENLAAQTRAGAGETAVLPTAPSAKSQAVIERIARDFPADTRELLIEGARRSVDYQDPAYAQLYLDRVARFLPVERGNEGHAHALTKAVARHLALWMTYEDTIRVADLKTRASRFERTERELRARDDQIVYTTEFMHPRIEELADTMPAPLGRWVLRSRLARGLLKPLTSKGRRIATGKLWGFFLLNALARLRPIRRHTLRYEVETARIEAWLDGIARLAPDRYELALELARCQRLIKGYGDTHARGMAKYERIRSALPALETRPDGASVLTRLREAALEDEEGTALDRALGEEAAA